MCDWVSPCLGCRDRTAGPSRRMSERMSEPLPGGKAHSISVIAGCPNPWRPQVSIARQRFAIQVASRRRLRQHQHQRLFLFVVVVVVIKTRAEIYDSVRIQLQFGLSVFLSVCPGIGSELGLLLFLLLLLLFVLLLAGWQ